MKYYFFSKNRLDACENRLNYSVADQGSLETSGSDVTGSLRATLRPPMGPWKLSGFLQVFVYIYIFKF